MNPGELLEISGYFWKTCALQAAVKLDVFTAIGDAQLTGKEISQKLSSEILFGKLEKGGQVVISAEGGKLSFAY